MLSFSPRWDRISCKSSDGISRSHNPVIHFFFLLDPSFTRAFILHQQLKEEFMVNHQRYITIVVIKYVLFIIINCHNMLIILGNYVVECKEIKNILLYTTNQFDS